MLLSSLANAAYEQGDWAKARTYWQEGLDVAEETHQKNASTARILANLSVVTLGQGQFEVSYDYLQRTLALARELHHAELICTTLCTLSWWAYEQKDYAQSYAYVDEAMSLARQMAHPEALTQVLCRLGVVAIASGAYEQAKQALDEAERLAQGANILWMTLDVILERGELALAQQDFAAAFDFFTEAKEKAIQMGFPEPQAFAHFYLAQILHQTGHPAEALVEVERCLPMFARWQHHRTAAAQLLYDTLQKLVSR